MPRKPRIFSESGYLHLVPKGNAGQDLFEDSEDRHRFLLQLRRCVDETPVSLNAYSLMSNHVHLLVHEEEDRASVRFMQKLCSGYARYYNRRYERTGHLFQSRYHSEPIEDESYLFAAFRYILNNPVSAGLCRAAADYEWSSYSLYGNPHAFVDSRLFYERIGSREELDAFLRVPDEHVFLEYDSTRKTDDWAREVIRTLLHVSSGKVLQTWSASERDDAIRALVRAGINCLQLQRLTGIGYRIIANAARLV